MPKTLKFKIALYLAVGLTALLALYTVLMIRQQRQDLLDTAVTHVMQLSDAIIRSTNFMMLQNQPYYVHRIIADVARDKDIDRVRIFRKNGTVIDSTYAPRSASWSTARRRGASRATRPNRRASGSATANGRASSRQADGGAWWESCRSSTTSPPASRRLPCARLAAAGSRSGRHRLFARGDRPDDPLQRDAHRRILARVRAAGRDLRERARPSARLHASARPGNRRPEARLR